jgi:hypothetical protein
MSTRACRIVVAAVTSVLCLFNPSFADAGLFRAYLSVHGADTNSCTLADPCRLLPAALAAVADGGEVWMLDSGNFNISQVNISKSVTILAVPGSSAVWSYRTAEVLSPSTEPELTSPCEIL